MTPYAWDARCGRVSFFVPLTNLAILSYFWCFALFCSVLLYSVTDHRQFTASLPQILCSLFLSYPPKSPMIYRAFTELFSLKWSPDWTRSRLDIVPYSPTFALLLPYFCPILSCFCPTSGVKPADFTVVLPSFCRAFMLKWCPGWYGFRLLLVYARVEHVGVLEPPPSIYTTFVPILSTAHPCSRQKDTMLNVQVNAMQM
jgi:hypothetical protein